MIGSTVRRLGNQRRLRFGRQGLQEPLRIRGAATLGEVPGDEPGVARGRSASPQASAVDAPAPGQRVSPVSSSAARRHCRHIAGRTQHRLIGEPIRNMRVADLWSAGGPVWRSVVAL